MNGKIAGGLAVLALAGGLLALPLSDVSSGLTRSAIYQPDPAIRAVTRDGLPDAARVIDLKTADGLTLKALRIDGDPDLPLFLVFHGNASTAHNTAQWLRPLIDQGYGFLFAEYRGYAGNPGKPSQQGTALDADAAYAEAVRIARETGHARPVYLIGHSLGGGVALDLTRRVAPDMVITIGTFTDIPSLAPKLARGLISDRYDNVAAIGTLNAPYYIIHGEQDGVVPVLPHARTLFETAARRGLKGGAFVFRKEGHVPDAALLTKAINLAVARGAAGLRADDRQGFADTSVMLFDGPATGTGGVTR